MSNDDLGSQVSLLKQMEALVKNIPKHFKEIGLAAGAQTDSIKGMVNSMKEAGDTAAGTSESTKDLNGAIGDLAERSGTAGRGMGQLGTAMAIAGVAANGVSAGYKKFKDVLSGVVSVATGLISTFFSLAKTIANAVIGTWEAFVGIAHKAAAAGREVAKEYETNVRAAFGNLADNEGKAVIDSFKALRTGADFATKSGLSLINVFGASMVAGLAGISEIAKGMAQSFTVLSKEFISNAAELAILNKGMLLSGEALAGMSLQARAAGETMTTALYETAQISTHLSKTYGISSKLIGKNLDELSKNMSNFGHMSREELASTSAYAVKLGISISSLNTIFDKFENFEDAATGAAKLAEAFGMNVDAMDLMFADSPAEQIDLMRKAFDETGKSIHDLSRSERKYFEDLTGLKGNELYAAFDPANAGISYDQLIADAQDATTAISPEEAMLEVAKNIEKTFANMTEESKGFFNAFTNGIQKGLSHSAIFRSMITSVTAALKKVDAIGRKLGKWIGGTGKDSLFGKSSIGFLKTYKKILDEAVSVFERLSVSIKELLKGGSIEKFVKDGQASFKKFMNSDSVQRMGGFILNAIASGIEYVILALPGLLDGIAASFTGATAWADIAGYFGSKESPIYKAIVKIGDLLNDPATTAAVSKSAKNLMKVMSDAFVEFLEENPEIGNAVGAVFATAMGAGILSTLYTWASGAFTLFTSYLGLQFIAGVQSAAGLGFTAQLSAGFASVWSVITTIGTAIGAFFGGITAAGVATGAAFVAAIVGVILLGKKLIEGLFDGIAILFDQSLSWGEKIGMTIAKLLQQLTAPFRVLTDIIDWIFGTEITTVIDEFFDNMGLTLAEFFSVSVPEFFSTFTSGFTAAFRGVIDSPVFSYETWRAAGAQLVAGLVDMLWTIPATLGDIGGAMITTFEGVFGIESPSKVFGELGGNLTAGLTSGLDLASAMGDAAGAAMSIAKKIIDPLDIAGHVGKAMPAVLGTVKSMHQGVVDAVGNIVNEIGGVNNKLTKLAPIAAEALVTKVAAGLEGDGTVTVKHEGLNIQVNFKVNIDAKELAAALGEDAEDGPFFIINTNRDGNLGAAEAAGA